MKAWVWVLVRKPELALVLVPVPEQPLVLVRVMAPELAKEMAWVAAQLIHRAEVGLQLDLRLQTQCPVRAPARS